MSIYRPLYSINNVEEEPISNMLLELMFWLLTPCLYCHVWLFASTKSHPFTCLPSCHNPLFTGMPPQSLSLATLCTPCTLHIIPFTCIIYASLPVWSTLDQTSFPTRFPHDSFIASLRAFLVFSFACSSWLLFNFPYELLHATMCTFVVLFVGFLFHISSLDLCNVFSLI